ncbi:unnamed protein product, partial [Ectocarpus sp. 4 AP-2014]
MSASSAVLCLSCVALCHYYRIFGFVSTGSTAWPNGSPSCTRIYQPRCCCCCCYCYCFVWLFLRLLPSSRSWCFDDIPAPLHDHRARDAIPSEHDTRITHTPDRFSQLNYCTTNRV